MAKLYKVELYVVDIDERYGDVNDIIEHVNDRLELVELKPFNIQEKEVDWSDEIDLNFENQPVEVYRKYFSKNL